ncbi:MAG TPA: alpha/beta hydrolase [Dongiaceae bacterium]|nr:alpha/beta hydrolase [Dongiaceae bacterium]
MQQDARRHFYLVRGLVREARHWGALPDLLRMAFPGARVTTLDIPGAGAYFRDASPTKVEAMVTAMRQDFLQVRREGEDATLIAISLGGMIASHWLHTHRWDFQRAVLINTSFGSLSPMWHRLRPAAMGWLARALMTSANEREGVMLRLVSNHADAYDSSLALWQSIRRERPVSLSNSVRQLWAATRFRSNIGAPPVPVLLLAGRADRMVSVECSRAIARAWRAPLIEHSSGGHDLSVDAPDWILEQVRLWLRNTPVDAESGAGFAVAP